MRILIFLLGLSCATVSYAAREANANLEIAIGYLAYQPPARPLLSNVIPEPTDAGLRGAELALEDNNSTGRFLKQQYSLVSKAGIPCKAIRSKACCTFTTATGASSTSWPCFHSYKAW